MSGNQPEMVTEQLPADRFVWIDPSEMTKPPTRSGPVNIYVDHWWMVDDQGRVAFYMGVSPQCNIDPRIVDRIMPQIPGAVGRVQIPIIYRPHVCL